MSVYELRDDSEFTTKLAEAAQRLVVVDFFATWCGPCNMIAPFYKQLSTKYPNVIFLKVDVDKCPGTAVANNVTAMPSFLFFRNRSVIDRLRGANKTELENKVKQYANVSAESATGGQESNGAASGAAAATGPASEFIDLVGLINKSQSECLNQSDDHTWEHALNSSSGIFLQSDVDEQILLHVTFTQAIKLHSLIIQGPPDNGPKDVKIFINQTRTLDFDSAMSNQPVQMLELKPEDIQDNNMIKLRYVKFQNVQNITLFFVNNQSSSETTVLNYLKFIGAPLSVTNMADFKRVAGQAGEAHG